MIKAGRLRIFTHFNLIHKGVNHDEFVKAALGDLMVWGFNIRRVLADRWFASRALLEWCQARDIEYIGPYKKQKNVIPYIHKFLKSGKDIVFSFFDSRGSNAIHQPATDEIVVISCRCKQGAAIEHQAEILAKKIDVGRGNEKNTRVRRYLGTTEKQTAAGVLAPGNSPVL